MAWGSCTLNVCFGLEGTVAPFINSFRWLLGDFDIGREFPHMDVIPLVTLPHTPVCSCGFTSGFVCCNEGLAEGRAGCAEICCGLD